MDKIKASVLVDKALWKAFQIYCIENELKLSEAAETALRQFISKPLEALKVYCIENELKLSEAAETSLRQFITKPLKEKK